MDLNKKSMKKIRELIVFTAILVVALWKFDTVLEGAKNIWGILFPFVFGGAIAFVINVPSSHNYIGSWCDRTSNVWCDSTAYPDNSKSDDKYC